MTSRSRAKQNHPGGSFRYREGRTRVTYFAEEGVFFKTSACPRFCKRRVLFCTQVRSVRGENPLTIHEVSAALTRLTPEVTGLPSLLPLNWQGIITPVRMRVPGSRSSNVSILIKEGVFFTAKRTSALKHIYSSLKLSK